MFVLLSSCGARDFFFSVCFSLFQLFHICHISYHSFSPSFLPSFLPSFPTPTPFAQIILHSTSHHPPSFPQTPGWVDLFDSFTLPPPFLLHFWRPEECLSLTPRPSPPPLLSFSPPPPLLPPPPPPPPPPIIVFELVCRLVWSDCRKESFAVLSLLVLLQ